MTERGGELFKSIIRLPIERDQNTPSDELSPMPFADPRSSHRVVLEGLCSAGIDELLQLSSFKAITECHDLN